MSTRSIQGSSRKEKKKEEGNQIWCSASRFGCGSRVKHKGERQKADQKQTLQDRVSMSRAWWSLFLVESWHMTLFSLPSLLFTCPSHSNHTRSLSAYTLVLTVKKAEIIFLELDPKLGFKSIKLV